MSKRSLVAIISFVLCLFSLVGCDLAENYEETYLNLITVPAKVTMPNALNLVCILNVTNPDPNNPETSLPPVSLGIFGYTTTTGEIDYFAYGEKKAVEEGELFLIEEGFYPIDFSRDGNTVSIDLKSPVTPLDKAKPGIGVTTAYNDAPPYDFYVATDIPGLYTFTSATGDANFRAFARFEASGIEAFYPATEDGTMLKGALPINGAFEIALINAGYNGAARLVTIPVECTNVQISYQL